MDLPKAAGNLKIFKEKLALTNFGTDMPLFEVSAKGITIPLSSFYHPFFEF